MQQHLDPILNAIDEEQFTYALQLIEKLQKRYRVPDLTLLSLQGLCFSRLGRQKDAIGICEKICGAHPEKKDTYQTINDILKMATDQESLRYLASSQEAGFRLLKSEVTGRMWFFAALKAKDWVAQRKAAVELQKGFVSREYFYYVLMSMLLLYRQTTGDKLLETLMYRMISTAAANNSEGVVASTKGPRIETPEEFYLYLDILQALGTRDEMLEALDGHHGQKYTSHDFLLLKLKLCAELNRNTELHAIAQDSIATGTDDWLVFKSYVNAARAEKIDAHTIRAILVQHGSNVSRNALLACVYLASLEESFDDLVESSANYVMMFADKLATYEDLATYLKALDKSQRDRFVEQVANLSSETESGRTILRTNLIKFRLLLSAEHDSDILKSSLENYVSGVHLRAGLSEQDNRHGDDSLLLAVQYIIGKASADYKDLLQAAILLEHGLTHSKHNFQFRLLLIEVYRSLGCWRLASTHFEFLSIKYIQQDTLSHVLLEGSTFEYISTMQISALHKSQQIYERNRIETPDSICQCFVNGTYSKVVEFIDFQERLERSIWKQEASVSTYRLQMMLDKFHMTEILPCLNDDEQLYDNKSRNVLFNLDPAAQKPSQEFANKEVVTSLRLQFQVLRMIQAVVTGRKLAGDLMNYPSTDSSMLLVSQMYTLKFGDAGSIRGTIAALEQMLTDLSLFDSYDAKDFSQRALRDLGRVVEGLKWFSIMAPHIRVVTKQIKTLFQQLHAKLKHSIDELRQSLAKLQLDVHVYDEIQVDAVQLKAVLENIKSSRLESITCLLSVLKTMKMP